VTLNDRLHARAVTRVGERLADGIPPATDRPQP